MVHLSLQKRTVGGDHNVVPTAIFHDRFLLAERVQLITKLIGLSPSVCKLMANGFTSIWLTAGVSYPASRISSRCLTPLRRSEHISYWCSNTLAGSARLTSLILQRFGSSLPSDNPGGLCMSQGVASFRRMDRGSGIGLCTLR